MIRLLSVLALLSQASCMVRYTFEDQTPVSAEAAAACRDVGKRHASDRDGGSSAETGCIRYVRETGKVPPP